jgi:4-amino-4-deoxy-L-arabinose transferase-like glycosyltransferase
VRRLHQLLTATRLIVAAALFVRLAGAWRPWLPSPVLLLALLLIMVLIDAMATWWAATREPAERVRSVVRQYGFEVGLAAVVALTLAARLPSIGSDLGHQPIDIDEHRLAQNIRQFFVTGTIGHSTVEHYPGVVFWMFTGSSLIAYLLALMKGAFHEIRLMPLELFVLAGRVTNVFVAAGTVVCTALIGRQLSRPAAGLLAALVVAIAPLAIWTTTALRNDPGQVLFVTAAVWAALATYYAHDSDDHRWSAMAGAFAGIATGIKYTSLFAVLPPLVAVCLKPSSARRASDAGLVVLGFVLAVATSNHFIWSDFPNFVRQLSDQVNITGAGHWAATENPAAEHVNLLGRYGAGWLLLWLAAAWCAYGLAMARPAVWVFCSFPILYSWFVTQRPSQFPRWVYPLLPFVAIAGSAGLLTLISRARTSLPVGARWRHLRTVAAAATCVAAVWIPVWSGTVVFSRRLTPPTHVLVEQWLAEHARGQTVLVENYWLDLTGTGVRVRRVRDLAQALNGNNLYALCANDWVVVPRPLFGSPGLRALHFVHRVSAVQTKFGGNMGYEYEIYATPQLPPVSTTDVRLDAPEAAVFLGPEWRADGSSQRGLLLPAGGAGIFFPPPSRPEVRIALDLSPDPSIGNDPPVKVSIDDVPVPLTVTAPTGVNEMRVGGSAPMVRASKSSELRVQPRRGAGPVRVVRVRIE